MHSQVLVVGELQKAIGGYFGDVVEDEIAGDEAIEGEVIQNLIKERQWRRSSSSA